MCTAAKEHGKRVISARAVYQETGLKVLEGTVPNCGTADDTQFENCVLSYWTKKWSTKVQLLASVDLSTKVRNKPDGGRVTEVEHCWVARLFTLELAVL